MNKLDNKEKQKIADFLERVLNDKNCIAFIGITNSGMGIVGDEQSIVTLLTMLIRQLRKDIDEDILKKAIDLSFMSEDELEKELLNKTKELLENIQKEIEKK